MIGQLFDKANRKTETQRKSSNEKAAIGRVLYVATDFRHFEIDGRYLNRDLGINGTCYRRLDPMYFAWLRHRFENDQKADESNSADFATIAAWAHATFGYKFLKAAWNAFQPKAARYRPPTMDWLADLGFHHKPKLADRELV